MQQDQLDRWEYPALLVYKVLLDCRALPVMWGQLAQQDQLVLLVM